MENNVSTTEASSNPHAAVEQSNAYELATDAREDLTCLSSVFSWLNELFLSIGDVAEKSEAVDLAKFQRIARMAEMGSNLAINWESTAESMAENFETVILAHEKAMGEVDHA